MVLIYIDKFIRLFPFCFKQYMCIVCASWWCCSHFHQGADLVSEFVLTVK